MLATPGNLWNSYATRIGAMLFAVMALTIGARPAMAKDSLQQFDDSVVSLVQQVSPAVVQILVTGYGAVEQRGQTALIGHQKVLGSGFVVDPEGYIITNAHVVQGAERVRVVMFTSENINSPHATLRSKTTTMDARVQIGRASCRERV